MAGDLRTANRGTVGVDSLLGCDIVDLEGRRIGELHDVVLDIATGRITHVFIAMNEPRYADQRVMVPWSAFRVEPEARRLRINTHADSSERRRPEKKGSAVERASAGGRFAND
jgi:sporulation protein YlmC with PRC-barrel domain